MRQLYKQELQKTVLHSNDGDDPLCPIDLTADRASSSSLMSRARSEARVTGSAGVSASSVSVSLSNVRGSNRNFEGVQGDAACRGELFGIENLMQFSHESILQSLRKKYEDAQDVGEIDGNDEFDDGDDYGDRARADHEDATVAARDDDIDASMAAGGDQSFLRMLQKSERSFPKQQSSQSAVSVALNNEDTMDSEATMNSEDLHALKDSMQTSTYTAPVVGRVSNNGDIERGAAGKAPAESSTTPQIQRSRGGVFSTSKRRFSVQDAISDALPANAVIDYLRKAVQTDANIHLLDEITGET
jgi:hypothetical protein